MTAAEIGSPFSGTLPPGFLTSANQRQFGVYVHVPYCRVRCGYCDFNTYTATELKGTTQKQYADEAVTEILLAQEMMRLAELPQRQVETVFFGGGTPTLLPATDLIKILTAIKNTWGVKANAEINVEANPDSVTPEYLVKLATAGFTRVSIGMQSAVPHVLKTLDRTHDPRNVQNAVKWVKDAGMQVSVDLIYGTPGETLADWEHSLNTAISYDSDHISTYALIVEEGTKLFRDIKRGVVIPPEDDLQASMYELADSKLTAAGFYWYELSNWAKAQQFESQHNLAYWQNTDWWGVGPGAHSHIGGIRWWNVKHPAAYAGRIAQKISPYQDRELLSNKAQLLENILLKTRLSKGMKISEIPYDVSAAVAEMIGTKLVDGKEAIQGNIVLTLKGRLLADQVVHKLTAHF